MKRKTWTIPLVVLVCIYIAVRVYHLGYFALWNDEVFSATVAQMTWPAMLRAVVADIVHPPLFYILLKLWIYIGGRSVLWMRTLPLLFSLFGLVPLFI